MKFGATLDATLIEEWRFHYIDYHTLKHHLEDNTVFTEEDEVDFINLLDAEEKKVLVCFLGLLVHPRHCT